MTRTKLLVLSSSIFIAPLVAHAEITRDTFCFSSGGVNSTNFELRTYYDSSSSLSWAFVRYQGSNQSIPLIMDESAARTLDKNAPDEQTTTWVEIYRKQITGEYRMVSQGTMVPSMIYTNRKSGKKTSFGLNASAVTDSGSCDWK
ncbi:hypothetical protein [Burkholderia sp. Ac-20365]|uniref:hypothetical protein n=1 Tax=Burkholderia sp. Ac-20365 TaxID=2703897 RepID=UPI00197B7A0F|nr:hypothetical protein [Burkholderia sp. Ac-20365]MBN3759868.1 hypothetical protein [Burkholderia sp. Ac-20365]